MVGCKRKIYDPDYLVQLRRENVHLTDDPIVEVKGGQVVTKSGDRYPADVIVSCINSLDSLDNDVWRSFVRLH